MLMASYLINAPVLFVRYAIASVVDRSIRATCSPSSGEACFHIEKIADYAILLIAVGLLWYLVGRGIESRLRLHTGDVSNQGCRQLAMNLILITIGVFCGIIGVLNWRERSFPWRLPLPFVAYLVWALALLVLGSLDLFQQTMYSGSPVDRGSDALPPKHSEKHI